LGRIVYQYLDAVFVRAPAWDAHLFGLPWPDVQLTEVSAEPWRSWLEQVWQVPAFATAIEAASPGLSRQVARIRAGENLTPVAARSAGLSVLRYLLRGSSRATPFGLLAGIAAARIGPNAVIETGADHRGTAKTDAVWLAGVIEAFESDAALLPGLSVVASRLVSERDGHLTIGHRPAGATARAPERVQVRATAAARAALEAARDPIGVPGLAAKLGAEFPAAPSIMINGLIARLVEQRFLLTNLRAPITSPDPLPALLDELKDNVSPDDARVRCLEAVRARLARHNRAPGPEAAREERQRATVVMTGMHKGKGPAIAVDLRLDWDLVVPEAVAAEAASAAGVLARLARRPVLSGAWTAWHVRFLDRYGPYAVVPVLDAADEITGIGYPAGYLGSPFADQNAPLSDRDKALLKLAQRAAVRGEREVVLDDALIEELAVTGPGEPVQPSTELTVRIHSASIASLNRGQFTLHVTGVSRGAGTVTGRFLYLLSLADQMRMVRVYENLPGVHRGSVLAQISAVPLYAFSENVARTPKIAGLVVSVGEHRAASPADQVPLSDLAVTADATRLHLISLASGRPVHTILPSAVDLTVHSHPLTRFLRELPVALAAPCAAFDWGAAAALPFVPALRYRRTVLSPARWTLEADDLPGRNADDTRWSGALAGWADQVALPENVLAGDGDQCIAVNLAEPSHRALLRAEVDRTGHARLRPAPTASDLGWSGGHPHEIVIPLAIPAASAAPVRPRGTTTATAARGHLPGCDGRLYLKLYAPRDLQDAIVTRHLPALTATLGDETLWWFIRYDDPEPHLRLRILLGERRSSAASRHAARWTSELRDRGLVRRVSWDTYYPETARFGGAEAIGAAEAFFAADSAAAVAQTQASAGKHAPDARALTAASMTDIAAAMTGDEADAMRWLVSNTRTTPAPLPRAVYDQAVALVCEPGTGKDGLARNLTEAWTARNTALARYRAALEQARALSPGELLPDLLHLHHARTAGPDIEAERTCLHLARAAALSWLARSKKNAS